MHLPADTSDGGSSELTLPLDHELRSFADNLAAMEFTQLSAQVTAPADENAIGDGRRGDASFHTDVTNQHLVLQDVMDPDHPLHQYLPSGIDWHRMIADQLSSEKTAASSTVEETSASQAVIPETPNSGKHSVEPGTTGSPPLSHHMEIDDAAPMVTSESAVEPSVESGADSAMESVAMDEQEESSGTIDHLELFGEDPDDEMQDHVTHDDEHMQQLFGPDIDGSVAQELVQEHAQEQEKDQTQLQEQDQEEAQGNIQESAEAQMKEQVQEQVEEQIKEQVEEQIQEQIQELAKEQAQVQEQVQQVHELFQEQAYEQFQESGHEQTEEQVDLHTQQLAQEHLQAQDQGQALVQEQQPEQDEEPVANSHQNVEQQRSEVVVDKKSQIPPTRGSQLFDPAQQLRIQSLPILENLSTQLLHTIFNSSYMDLLQIVTQPNSDEGQAYAILVDLFSQTKRIYDPEPFLSTSKLKLEKPEQLLAIRKANLATYLSSCFGSANVGFFHLNEFFLDVFVPEGGRLLKAMGQIYLGLKTQSYIASLEQNDRPPSDILNEIFNEQANTELLLARRSGAKQLSPSENDFINRINSRREHLKEQPIDDVEGLRDKYNWHDFLKEMISYVSKNWETILNPQQSRRQYRKHTPPSANPAATEHAVPDSHLSPGDQYMQGATNEDEEMPAAPDHAPAPVAAAAPVAVVPTAPTTVVTPMASTAAAAAAADAPAAPASAAITAQQVNTTQSVPVMATTQALNSASASQQQQFLLLQQPAAPATVSVPEPSLLPPFVPTSEQHGFSSDYSQNMALSLGAPPLATAPHLAQTTPTSVLYQQARLAATSRTSPNSRRAGLPSQRRPWTHEEEHALMAGLDRVKGPHWSQILEMFGAGGTVSEALKDRNQVQLKDKARNLKLFFLKSGLDVPYYLQFVTGELKTRAPQQAAKNERRKTQDQSSKDDASPPKSANDPVNERKASQPADGEEGKRFNQNMEQDNNQDKDRDQEMNDAPREGHIETTDVPGPVEAEAVAAN